jgi:DeoR family glycerol-3-phosphate regulon repressor
MKVYARQNKLVEIVRRQEKASVGELAQLLDASRETIRRDLAQLANSNKIHKIHGGATMPRVLGEGPFQQRLSDNVEAKVKIAQTAASLFKPGETLLIDTGSTTLFFAEEIAKIAELTVVTNSTEIARTISKVNNGSRVFLLGGEFRADNSQTYGTMVVSQIKSFRAHHAVLTIGAMDKRTGAMDFNIEEALVAQAMIEQSEKLTVLADYSKFNALASFEVCPLEKIHRLVCDTRPPGDICEFLETAGGQLILP